MSIFGNIMHRIFGGSTASPSGAQAIAGGSASATTDAAASSGAAQPVPAATGMPASVPEPNAAPGQKVDVEAVLSGLSAKAGQKLNWQESIVDLMKLLDLDSSLAARKELAQELHYSGDTDDSAKMNVWLHREVMQKLAENGGKLPAGMQA